MNRRQRLRRLRWQQLAAKKPYKPARASKFISHRKLRPGQDKPILYCRESSNNGNLVDQVIGVSS